MADKKRDKSKAKKAVNNARQNTQAKIETFDDTLDVIMQQTLAAVVEKETYPRGRLGDEIPEDGTQIYYTPQERYKKTGRYQHSPDTVAQHMVDRTQFRH